MKILGIGNDIIEIERVEKAIKRTKKFKEKVFSEKEIEIVEKKSSPFASYAGRFAAKESVAKAFGTGIKFSLTDIEILNDKLGKPYVNLRNKLKEKYDNIDIMITISHNRKVAIATAIVISKE
ncbi:holo-[acyl-carrier-protein] synthase [Hypnocyclicus thermotrophus]|uniref:Holo-[acyl-carrier-protein] synthase n=1 Tax=Hypnocyclicus thermotrophus TaxID=1627895 RepID=A0AA46DZ56_9FUSO|nr:holo-ACP synthase [Hypnocyclicus thermotrophus]TDT70585.1 holo-[acyl-carrier-protein] synthase [Hypnocyclicus thermotrophus]